jgi:hypothetical protein
MSLKKAHALPWEPLPSGWRILDLASDDPARPSQPR